MPRTDKYEPLRAKLLKANELPNVINPIIDMAEPTLEKPNTENEDPTRDTPLNARELPNRKKSKTDIELPT
jgi:hypothetical protein